MTELAIYTLHKEIDNAIDAFNEANDSSMKYEILDALNNVQNLIEIAAYKDAGYSSVYYSSFLMKLEKYSQKIIRFVSFEQTRFVKSKKEDKND